MKTVSYLPIPYAALAWCRPGVLQHRKWVRVSIVWLCVQVNTYKQVQTLPEAVAVAVAEAKTESDDTAVGSMRSLTISHTRKAAYPSRTLTLTPDPLTITP
jgi:hypothetical protein